ncbi:type II secretion system F family protein [Sphingomonas lutea]|uniref:Type II secretion system F family protein n=1 Tax=Sphingomonas lutea TaxID=1045317 RepID=A0A7G9SJ87_9SPHN|nr:type II secretion system F family protein [Sphingomonas lutea]QNN67912.1 type II secretion system F family protein [Sphingomonas lutea]
MNPTWLKALALVCLFGAVFLAVEVLVSWLASNRAEGKAINLRLRMIGRGRTTGETLNILRRSDSVIPAGLPPFATRLAMNLERTLMQAQLTIPTGRLMLGLVVAPIVLFFVVLAASAVGLGMGVSGGRILISAVFALLLGAVLPIMFLNMRAKKTRKKMQDQFPVALDVFVRGLRAGHPIAAALDLLTVEMPDPIGTQFGMIVDEVTYGAELRDALQGMAERWDLEDMRMFVVSLSVQSETGGNLAEILENLSHVIRERQSMMMKVRALSSEGRMTAAILTILPIGTFVGLFLLNPAFFFEVSDDPWFIPGFTILIIWYLIGVFAIRKMIDLKV